jgi:hypothetical protein
LLEEELLIRDSNISNTFVLPIILAKDNVNLTQFSKVSVFAAKAKHFRNKQTISLDIFHKTQLAKAKISKDQIKFGFKTTTYLNQIISKKVKGRYVLNLKKNGIGKTCKARILKEKEKIKNNVYSQSNISNAKNLKENI